MHPMIQTSWLATKIALNGAQATYNSRGNPSGTDHAERTRRMRICLFVVILLPGAVSGGGRMLLLLFFFFFIYYAFLHAPLPT